MTWWGLHTRGRPNLNPESVATEGLRSAAYPPAPQFVAMHVPSSAHILGVGDVIRFTSAAPGSWQVRVYSGKGVTRAMPRFNVSAVLPDHVVTGTGTSIDVPLSTLSEGVNALVAAFNSSTTISYQVYRAIPTEGAVLLDPVSPNPAEEWELFPPPAPPEEFPDPAAPGPVVLFAVEYQPGSLFQPLLRG